MKYHLSMDLNAAINMAFNLKTNPFGGNGFYKLREILGVGDMNQGQVVRELKAMQERGMIAIPSEGCTYPDGMCKGHKDRGQHARRLHEQI